MMQKLGCSKKFDPALFIGESWSVAEQDERADALAEIDLSTIALVTCLKTGEEFTTGEERLNRLKETRHVRLGGCAFLALWEDPQFIPESWKEQFLFVLSTPE